MTDNRRQLRLEKELREVISRYLIADMRGELEGLVSVSRIQVAPDLRSAKVFVSIMGTDAQRESSMAAIEDRARDVQTEVHHQLKLRFTPRLSFFIDTSLEKQLKVEGILRDLELQRAGKSPETSRPAKFEGDADDESEDT